MIEIYTDGACRGNGKENAIGGWGYHVIDRSTNEKLKQDFGGEKSTTNNRMELKAAIEALKFAKELSYSDKMRVKIYTDSNYVYKGITTWIHGWIRKDWKDVKNIDLWKELDSLNNDVYSWSWVKAHAGHEENEIADLLANKGCDLVSMTSYKELTQVEDNSLEEKRERFIVATSAIYAIGRSAASDLFDKYYEMETYDYHSVTQRVFLAIMEH